MADTGTGDVENPELTNALPLKPGVGPNIAVYARNVFLVLISTFPAHSPTFFSRSSPYLLIALVLANAVSRVGPAEENGYRNMCYCALIEGWFFTL